MLKNTYNFFFLKIIIVEHYSIVNKCYLIDLMGYLINCTIEKPSLTRVYLLNFWKNNHVDLKTWIFTFCGCLRVQESCDCNRPSPSLMLQCTNTHLVFDFSSSPVESLPDSYWRA